MVENQEIFALKSAGPGIGKSVNADKRHQEYACESEIFQKTPEALVSWVRTRLNHLHSTVHTDARASRYPAKNFILHLMSHLNGHRRRKREMNVASFWIFGTTHHQTRTVKTLKVKPLRFRITKINAVEIGLTPIGNHKVRRIPGNVFKVASRSQRYLLDGLRRGSLNPLNQISGIVRCERLHRRPNTPGQSAERIDLMGIQQRINILVNRSRDN